MSSKSHAPPIIFAALPVKAIACEYMSDASDKRSEEFLKISGQFKLGALVTESSHPVTANLSDVAKRDIGEALDLLFQVDEDVVKKYREFVETGRAGEIAATVLRSLQNGGRIFFTGCGSTGRLSIQLVSIWRDFWQQQRARVSKLTSDTWPEEGDKCQVTRDPIGNPDTGHLPPVTLAGSCEDFENRAFPVMA